MERVSGVQSFVHGAGEVCDSADAVDYQWWFHRPIGAAGCAGQGLVGRECVGRAVGGEVPFLDVAGDRAALEKARTELEELRGQLHQISGNIFSAGGGS